MNQIKLSNGKTATSFIADDNSPLAIVHLSVIQRLAALLTTSSVPEIIGNMMLKLAAMKEVANTIVGEIKLQDYIECLKSEVAFHESVNLIKEYKSENDDVIIVCLMNQNIDLDNKHQYIEIPSMPSNKVFQYCQHLCPTSIELDSYDYDQNHSNARSMMVGDYFWYKENPSIVYEIEGTGIGMHKMPPMFIEGRITFDEALQLGMLVTSKSDDLQPIREAFAASDSPVNVNYNKPRSKSGIDYSTED